MNILVTNGPTWGVDPKFNPVCGFDASGKARPLMLETGGGLKLGLPSGAATEAKQPALGTAGVASVDVLTVQGRAGMTPVVTGGITNRVAVEFTRPSDITAYTVGDAVCNSTSAPALVTFVNVARLNGGTGMIVSGRLTTNSANSVNGSFRLYLFSETVPATNDNAAYPLSYSDVSKRIGYIDFVLSSEATGACSMALTTGVQLDYASADASRNLFGILVAKGAYTPASGQKFTLELGTVND